MKPRVSLNLIPMLVRSAHPTTVLFKQVLGWEKAGISFLQAKSQAESILRAVKLIRSE